MIYWKRAKKANILLASPQPDGLVGCYFQAEKFRSDGTITYRGPRFHNLVLNTGLDLIGGNKGFNYLASYGGSVNTYINVGTSSIAPTVTQSGLQTYLTSTDNGYGDVTRGNSVTAPVHRWWKKTFEFAIGSCTGNLTEVGLSAEANTDYFNRQLFLDEADSPTTITVLADEGLRITVETYFYTSLAIGGTTTGTFTVSGTAYPYTLEQLGGDWLTTVYLNEVVPGWFGYRVLRISDSLITTANVVGNDSTQARFSLDAYTAGDYYRTATWIWPAGEFVGDINSILLNMPKTAGFNDEYGYSFTVFRLDSPITVADTHEIRLSAKRSWGRYAT